MPVRRVYLLQEEFRQARIDVRVIAGSILHVHQKHLCKRQFSRVWCRLSLIIGINEFAY